MYRGHISAQYLGTTAEPARVHFNRHAAFGLGIHRCIGSYPARMELRVALEVWLERIPRFTLADPAPVQWSAG